MHRRYRHLRPVVTQPGDALSYTDELAAYMAELARRGHMIEAYLDGYVTTAAAEAVAAVVEAAVAAEVVLTSRPQCPTIVPLLSDRG
jgi:hypothetical protein